MTLTAYEQLKHSVSEQFVLGTKERYSEVLHSTKEIFRDGINSVRRFEQIVSIGQLLKVLELRDILSEDNVDCLKSVASKLPQSKEVLKILTDYEKLHVPREHGNFVRLIASSHLQKQQDDNSISDNLKKKQRIIETIIEEIGSFWRDLGRNLRIRERDIDDIDFHNKTLAVKVTKLLEIYERKADRQKWFFVLCEALEKCQRKDLVRTIQEIMTMNI